ncbi:hypothetical protein D9M68_857460 [compost metagenome]
MGVDSGQLGQRRVLDGADCLLASIGFAQLLFESMSVGSPVIGSLRVCICNTRICPRLPHEKHVHRHFDLAMYTVRLNISDTHMTTQAVLTNLCTGRATQVHANEANSSARAPSPCRLLQLVRPSYQR